MKVMEEEEGYGGKVKEATTDFYSGLLNIIPYMVMSQIMTSCIVLFE